MAEHRRGQSFQTDCFESLLYSMCGSQRPNSLFMSRALTGNDYLKQEVVVSYLT